MHGTIMLLLFATPTFAGFANEIMPLQIGAPDVAFPRLNMLSYWLFLFGGLIVLGSLLVPGRRRRPSAGPPTRRSTASIRSPGIGADMWIMGLALSGFGTILGAVNFLTTIVGMRAPGMTMFRMPIFTWNTLFTSILVLMAFPVLAAALLVLEADRRFGAVVFDARLTAGRCCGSTCSGSSAIPRSTSSRCRSSASSPRSSRSSPASRSSAI